MSDIAILGIGVDSSGVKAANEELGKLPAKGAAAEAATNKLAKSTDLLTRLYKDLAKAMAAWKVLDFIRDSALLAARFETMGVVMGVAGNNAGYTRKEMAALEQQMQKTGISMVKSREVLTSLATANIDLAFAVKLARASQDLAVVANINSSDAFARMVHGIKSGETEVLKTMGLNVSFENSYKKLAAQLGINKDSLTEQQKTLARTNAVLGESTKYAGIYEESMTTAGKAITSLTRYWEDFQVKAGGAFLPALTDAVFRLTDGLKAANKELDKAGSDGVIDKIGRGLAMAFRYVYETVVVLGANIAYVFGTIGNEIGLIAAQAAALLRGDFAQVAELRRMGIADAEANKKAIDAFSASVVQGTSASQESAKAAQGDAEAQEARRMAAGKASRDAEANEERRLKAADAAKKAAEKAAKAAETAAKHSREYILGLEQERQGIGATEQQIKMLAAAREAAKAPTAALALKIMETAFALTVEEQAWKDSEEAKANAKTASEQRFGALSDELVAMYESVEAAKRELETYGMLPAAITRYNIAKLEQAKLSQMAKEGTEAEVAQLTALIAMQNELLGLQTAKQSLDELFDPGQVETFGEALKKAFSGAGDAMSGLANALGDYMNTQDAAERDRKKAMLAHKGDAEALGRALDKINNKERKDQIAGYAEMASAGKKFFKEHTAGYKVLDAIEKAFHAWKMITMVTEFATKTGLITAETAAVITGNTQQATSAVTASATESAAKMTVAGANAVAAVANQGNGDPYTAFFRIAAMAAIMAGLGLAVGGGGGGGGGVPISRQRQEANGTGSILGDDSAKSESLARAWELLADNSNIALEHSSRMLAQLRSINDGISGMAAFVARSSGLRGTPADLAALGVGSSKGALGFSKSSTELRDQGLYFPGIATGPSTQDPDYEQWQQSGEDGGWMQWMRGQVRAAPTTPQTVGNIMTNGIQAGSYADVHKEKSSWWGLSKSSSDETQLGDVDAELKRQLSLTVGTMYSSILEAAAVLGEGGTELEAALLAVQLPFERISLMGLTGDEIEAEISAAFSLLGDQMAALVADDLGPFQKVGEGMYETLIRVASGVEVAQFELERFGLTAIEYSDIANTQGDVGAEIVRQSIMLAESYGDTLTGLGEIMLTLDGTAGELADTYEQLLAVQEAMNDIGVAGDMLSRATIRGARDLGVLQDGIEEYFDRVLSDEERFEVMLANMRGEFAAIGQTMPLTVDALQAFVEGIDQTTEAGQRLFGQVMALMPDIGNLIDAYDTVTQNAVDAAEAAQDALDDQLEAAERALDAAYNNLQRAVERERKVKQSAHDAALKMLNEQLKAHQAAAAKLQKLSSSLHNAMDKLADNAPGAELDTRQGAQAQIRAALARARSGGGLPDAEDINRALGVATKDAPELFATYEEYARDFFKTANDIKALTDLSDQALSAEEQIVFELQRQIEQENAAHLAEMARLDSILEQARMHVDTAKGIDTRVLTVEQAIREGFAALAAYEAAKTAAGKPATGGGGGGGFGSSFGDKTDILDWTAEQYDRATDYWKDYAETIAGQSWEDFNAGGGEMYGYKSGTRGYVGPDAGVFHDTSAGTYYDPDRGAWFGPQTGETAAFANQWGMTGIGDSRAPGFANGGDHAGGWREVGERGHEIEYTGPSSIMSSQRSRALVDNSRLEAEVAGMRMEIRSGLLTIAKNTKDTADATGDLYEDSLEAEA